MNVKHLDVSVYKIPTDRPEGDGTFAWDATTMVLVAATAEDGQRGLGYSYTAGAAATLVHELLTDAVIGCPVDDVPAAWERMIRAVRNVGRQGVAATAISAVDLALWDLKGRVAGRPLYQLLGARRDKAPIYGSGGFTTYTDRELTEQLAGWVAAGIPQVKMKIGVDWGARPEEDVRRVRVAREAIGEQAGLMVDANGAYSVRQAVEQARRFADSGVSYFEEPVSSDHLDQLAFVRANAPMAIAAGEYGYDAYYFREMLRVGAVDILQADVTRCLGITGWLKVADLAHDFAVPLSAHCAPAVHVQIACVGPAIAHLEYFHDHVRIEEKFFEGMPAPKDGFLRPDPARPGLGLTLRRSDAERFKLS